jgi:DNA-binding NtrC family response regulator
VSSAEDAVHELERNGIDLVFSDIVMTGKTDGLDLADFIQHKHPHLPVLLTTGFGGESRTQRSDFPILKKPYQIHDLSQAISRLRN